MSISQGRSATLIRVDQPERVEVLRTSSNLFRLFGAQAAARPAAAARGGRAGKAPTVVLSHGFWMRMFGADPGIVGRSITLNGLGAGAGDSKNQFTVVGVLPADFLMNNEVMQTVASIEQLDVFLPLPFGADAVKRRGDENYNLMARLKPGVTMEQAQADISLIAGADPREGQARPDVHHQRRAAARSGRRQRAARRARAARLGRAGAADRVRQRRQPAADARQRPPEGSGDSHGARRRWQRLVRQLLTESVLLGLLGGAAGLLLAQASLSSSAPSTRGTFRGSTRSPSIHGAGVHLRRVAPDRHRLRPGARAPRREGRSNTPSRPAAAAARGTAASERRGGACAACSSSPSWRCR